MLVISLAPASDFKSCGISPVTSCSRCKPGKARSNLLLITGRRGDRLRWKPCPAVRSLKGLRPGRYGTHPPEFLRTLQPTGGKPLSPRSCLQFASELFVSLSYVQLGACFYMCPVDLLSFCCWKLNVEEGFRFVLATAAAQVRKSIRTPCPFYPSW